MNLAEYEMMNNGGKTIDDRFELDRRIKKTKIFNKEGGNLFAYRTGGNLTPYKYVLLRVLVDGSYEKLEPKNGRVDLIVNGARYRGTVESLVCLILRENGLYKDRIRLTETIKYVKSFKETMHVPVNLTHYESLPNGEIRNIRLPDRIIHPVYGSVVKLTSNGETREKINVDGIDIRVMLDDKFNKYLTAVKDMRFVGQSRTVLYSKKLTNSWRTVNKKIKLSKNNVKIISSKIPINHRVLLEENTNYCCCIKRDGNLGDTIYNVYDGEPVNMVIHGTIPGWLITEKVFKGITCNGETKTYESFKLMYYKVCNVAQKSLK